MLSVRAIVVGVLLASGVAACGNGATDQLIDPSPDADVAVISVTSPAFAEGEAIPVEYSCDGGNAVPELSWSAPPSGTVSQAIVVDDPDAPRGTFTHWLVASVPADRTALSGDLPPEVIQGENDAGDVAWQGPCPPPDDDAHRYRFTVLALDVQPGLDEGFGAADLVDAVEGHVIARGTLTGTFDR